MSNKKQQMETNETELRAGVDIGAPVSDVAFGVVDPSENAPTFVPGKNWAIGQVLAGRYLETRRIYSDKFTAGKKDADGRIYRDLHILADLKTGKEYGIWSVGVLANFFRQCPVLAPVKLTYNGIAKEALKKGQNPPHDFTFELGQGYRLDRSKAQDDSEEMIPPTAGMASGGTQAHA